MAVRKAKRGEKALLFAGALAALERMGLRGSAKPRLSPPHPWRPLTEAEIRFVWPVLEALCAHEVGRPARHDLVSRFEACLEAACTRLPWRLVETRSAPGMKGDTLHRTFRRWTERRVWMLLLLKIARERPGLPALEYFLCRAFRRAWRGQGMRGVLVARATGLMSALRAPFSRFPDPGLSARCHAAFISPGLAALPGWPPEVQRSFGRASRALFRLFAGTRRIRRCWEPA